MKRTTKGFYGLLISGVFSLAIFAGCGGGGGGGTTTSSPTDQTLSGVAAKGAAIVSVTVTVKDKNGTTKTGTTGSDGKYEVDVAGMTAPFLMRVPAGSNYLYSVATATGTANIHPFTDLIIRNWYKVKGADVETDFAGGALSQVPTASEIDTIEAVIRNILSSWLSNVGLSASTFNLITSSFNADTTGFDKVLDNTDVVIDNATGNVTVTTADPITGIESTMVTTTISTNLTTADTTNPSDPTGLSAIPASTSSIVLVWNASTDNIGVAGYNIYRGGSKIGSSPYPVYSDTGLTSGTNYCYQVEAFDGAGNASANKSSEVCATPAADTTAPSPPTNLTATAVSTSQINLAWTASTSTDVVGYAIYSSGTKIAAVTGTSYSDTGLSSGTQYSYEVKAVDGAGNASTAITASATTLAGIPSAPTGVSASAGDGQVAISWSASSGATSYNIYWSNTTGVTAANGTKIAGATSPYTHTGLTGGAIYYYVVTAVNATGESILSSQVSVTPTTLTGSWYINNSSGIAVLTFISDGNYIQAEDIVSDPCAVDGMEKGTYTSTSNTITIANPLSADTNGCGGLSDSLGTSISYAISGNQLTITGPTGSAVLTKVATDASNPLIGSWYHAPDTVFAFFSDGTYMVADNGPHTGSADSCDATAGPEMERGYYTSTADSITINGIITETNCRGFSPGDGIYPYSFSYMISGNQLTLNGTPFATRAQ